jgi:hypothetical protein
MGFKLLLTSSLLVLSSSALEIGNITSLVDDLDSASHSFWGSIESVTTRKSRKKSMGFESKPLMKYPNGQEIKTPTVIFHGVRQKCVEPQLVDYVTILSEGTGGYVECIEIGNGDVTSIFTPMNI